MALWTCDPLSVKIFDSCPPHLEKSYCILKNLPVYVSLSQKIIFMYRKKKVSYVTRLTVIKSLQKASHIYLVFVCG